MPFERALTRLTSYIRHFAALCRGKLIRLQPGTIRHGGRVLLGPRTRVEVATGGELILGGALTTDRDVEIVVYRGGRLVIGDNVYIGHGSTLVCAESIAIGSETLIGDLVSIRDVNHRRVVGVPMRKSGTETRPIIIGQNCWLGSKVTLVAGCGLGNEVTVAANAVVAGTFSDNLLLGGIPARAIERKIAEG